MVLQISSKFMPVIRDFVQILFGVNVGRWFKTEFHGKVQKPCVAFWLA